MNRRKYIFVTWLLVVLTVALGGCASAAPKTSDMSAKVAGISFSEQAAESDAISKPVNIERKIIRNADIDLRVRDVDQALEKLTTLCNENEGYVVNSHINRDDERVWANLSIKVPEQQLDSTITAIAQLGEVTNKVISTEDITEEYYDAEARLKVLKAKEERLLGLMNQATGITEIVSVEDELGKTRSDIEVLAGRLKYLTNATSYSLIRINLRQGIPGALQAPQGTMGKAMKGLLASINGLITFAGQTFVFFFIALPWLVVGLLLYLLIRHFYQKLKAARFQK